MAWIRLNSPYYDEARKLFNAMIGHEPAVIGKYPDPGKVAEARRYGQNMP
ncbi:hypothetical protein [Arthrobacter sp. ISL-95]|nr:hypothetical protein [Arthrobacter sp. ISL-95]MBT2586725.1 hypothetical protein [Arthrobacter sp. ISL-95]